MTFFSPLDNSPGRDRVCDDQKSLLLKAFPAKQLETHFRNGWRFRSDACTTAFAYDPDFCVPGAVKMDPENFGPEKDAVIGMIQSAFNCSPVGETMETLKEIATQTLENNLWRAIETDLIAALVAEGPVAQPAGQAVCALAAASQFLATNGNCGKGVIVGPFDWFIQLGTDHLVWNGTYHTDTVGNIVIPLSVDNDTVYAFDSNIDIRITEILLMDERAPGLTSVNDRVVRAEQIYGIGIDPCVVGAFPVSACCDCGGGGGGGGGNVTVTNFPANQNVTVTNFPADSDFDFEELLLCDDNGPFIHRSLYNAETGAFVSATNTDLAGAAYVPVGPVVACGGEQPTVRAMHKMATDANPWTAAGDAPGAVITSITYTVISGTVDVTAANSQIVAGIPAGLSATWNNDTEGTLQPLISVNPVGVGDRTYVNWTERV